MPKFTDGAVKRNACVRGVDPEDCCKKMIDVYIRNCFTYNVYYLQYTDVCYRAYCFGMYSSNCLMLSKDNCKEKM